MTAIAEPTQQPGTDKFDEHPTGRTSAGGMCPQCAAAGQFVETYWCKSCGYYNLAHDPEQLPVSAADSTGSKHSWYWSLLIAVSLVFFISLSGRIITDGFGHWRSVWGVGQLILGLLFFLSAHLAAFAAVILKNDQHALSDLVVRPLSFWFETFAQLPRTRWRVISAACGLLAALFAFVIVGGIPTSFADSQRVYRRTVAAVRSDGSLESAIEGFAEQGAGDIVNQTTTVVQAGKTNGKGTGMGNIAGGMAGDMLAETAVVAEEAIEELEEEIERDLSVECAIIGYIPAARDRSEPDSFILAALVGGRLRTVGTVSEGLPEELREEIRENLLQLKRSKPLIPNRHRGVWLAPKYKCQVEFSDWSKQRELENPKFDMLLGTLKSGV